MRKCARCEYATASALHIGKSGYRCVINNTGGRYGRRETRSGTDARRDEQCYRSAEGSQAGGQKAQEDRRQESREKGSAEEESQEGEEGGQEVRGEEVGQENRQEGRQENREESCQEKEGQEVEALATDSASPNQRRRSKGQLSGIIPGPRRAQEPLDESPEAFVLGLVFWDLRPRQACARRLTRNTAAAQTSMPATAIPSSRSPNSR